MSMEGSKKSVVVNLPPVKARDERGPTALTDLGNCERFARDHGGTVKYVHRWNKWLWWNGRYWEADNNGEIDRLGKQTAMRIYAEAADFTDKKEAQAVARWAHSSQSRHRLSAMLELAKSELPIPLDHETLDSDPWSLNCENGTVDLQTGKLHKHRPEDFQSMTTGVDYPTTDKPVKLWLRFLSEIFEDNQELIGFVQRFCGVALIGKVYEHILAIAIGSGDNGKSVTTETWCNVLGDYALSAQQGLITTETRGVNSQGLSKLFRKRLVIVSETNDGARLNEGLVKRITGGDRICDRNLYENFWEFDPTHTLLMVTNHRPVVKGTDHGIWRRIRLIPFNAKIPVQKQDKKLTEKLRDEYPAILRWMVQGCLEYQKSGLQEPEEVLLATSEYRGQEDTLGTFIDDCCMVNSRYQIKAGSLYSAYRNWADTAGEKAETQRTFGQSMTERGFDRKRNNGLWYQGLTLNGA